MAKAQSSTGGFLGHVADLPCGDSGMVVRTNRLRAQPGEFVDANGVQFDQLGLRKEAGSVLLDAIGVSGSPRFTGTLAESSADWLAGVSTYRGSGVFVKEVGTAIGQNPTTVVTVPIAGVAAGNSLFVIVGVAHLSLSAPTTTAVTDSKGNTYVLSQSIVSANAPLAPHMRLRVFRCLNIVTPLVSGDLITVTTEATPAGAGVFVNVIEFSGLTTSSLDRTAQNEGSGTLVTVNVGSLTTVPETLITAIFYRNASAAATGVVTPTNGFVQRGNTNDPTSSPFRLNAVASLSRVDVTSPIIIGLFDFNPQRTFVGTGTVSTTAGSQTVTGVGTLFLTEANPNDFIRIGCDSHRIIAIASNISLTVAEPWAVTYVAQPFSFITEERLITATSDGAIFMELNGDIDAISLKTGLIPSLIPGRFVLGGRENGPAVPRKLFWFDGRDVVQVLNGNTNTMADIALPPADWTGCNQPVNGVFSGSSNRLVGFGNINDPHRLYFSLATNHEDFTTSPLTLEVYSGIGDRLWGGVHFNGLLMVWKSPRGIFFIDDSDSANLVLRLKAPALGCAPSPHAVLAIDDDVLFMAANGSFHLLSAVETMGGTRASDLSYRLGISRWLRDNVNLGRLNQTVSVWYSHKKQAYFAVPSAGSQSFVNDLLLKFDFGGVDTGGNVRFSYSRRDTPGALAVRRETDTIERWISGEAGFVYLQDREARNKAGSPYTGSATTPALDFSHQFPQCRTKRKNYEHLELVFEPVDAGTLVVQPIVDGQPRGTPLTYDPTLRRQRQRISVGDGHTLQVSLSESTLNGDFSIDDILVSYNIGDEDQSRGPR